MHESGTGFERTGVGYGEHVGPRHGRVNPSTRVAAELEVVAVDSPDPVQDKSLVRRGREDDVANAHDGRRTEAYHLAVSDRRVHRSAPSPPRNLTVGR